MKPLTTLTFLLASIYGRCSSTRDGDITQVIEKLEEIMGDIRTEGMSDREKYAKFKCYCDQNSAQKNKEIKDETTTSATLQSKIAELLAHNGALSTECAELKTAREELATQMGQQDTMKVDDNTAFDTNKAELEQGIGNLNLAIQALTDANGDQTQAAGADNTEYLKKRGGDADTLKAGEDLLGSKYAALQMSSVVKTALAGASAFVDPKQQQLVESFLQGDQPFASKGTYTSQGAGITGMLLNMRDNLQAQLDRASKQISEDNDRYDKVKVSNQARDDTMRDLYDEKQSILGANDADLATRRGLLQASQGNLANAREFLASLTTQCDDKKAEYDVRVMQRANEEHAIQEAIKILNSDEAFDTFRNVQATSDSTPAPTTFLQIGQEQEKPHRRRLHRAANRLRRKGLHAHRKRMSQIATMLRQLPDTYTGGNPFEVVLEAIEKMHAVIQAEETADQEQKQWCDNERTDTQTIIDDRDGVVTLKRAEEGDLIAQITQQDGLEEKIAEDEEDMRNNIASQTSQTETRQSENLAYQQQIATIVKTEGIIQTALKVLKRHWSEAASFLEADKAGARQLRVRRASSGQTPPDTWDQSQYQGQKQKGDQATQLLKFVYDETVREENEAHAAEQRDQHDYEDSMATLKSEYEQSAESLAGIKANYITKKKDLMEATKALDTAIKEKAEADGYMLKIKPGCDFITTNLAVRVAARQEEDTALTQAKEALKTSPTYLAMMESERLKQLGPCAKPCTENPEVHVKCKACLAGVSMYGYCTTNPTTPGCDDLTTTPAAPTPPPATL